jgi:acetolactate synthase-1/2/3 large subunit
MNSADALIKTLIENGLEVVFANPGTSEMHLVAAIDHHPEIRPVLGLFEGVVTGAADGYARMSGKAAANLLHLGPGLGNGFANIHNAKKARTPMLNIVGDHATYHLQYNAPLTSDLDGLAKASSDWVGRSSSPDDLSALGSKAWQAAHKFPGQIATMLVPADCAWGETDNLGKKLDIEGPEGVDDALVDEAYKALSSNSNSMLFLGGEFLDEESVTLAGKIATASGCRLATDTFVKRHRRGAGLTKVEPIPYFAEMAEEFLAGVETIVFIGTRPPVSFFAYPGKKSFLSPEECKLIELASPFQDGKYALHALSDMLKGNYIDQHLIPNNDAQAPTTGALDPTTLGPLFTSLLPEDAVVCDEAATSGFFVTPHAWNAKPLDWLALTGGSIGQGLPLATGAAIGAPGRPVVCLHGDGGAMYTIQSLWTQAREGLNVTNLIFSNKAYAILQVELERVGALETGDRATSMLSLDNPEINWVSLANSLGVPAKKTLTVEEFHKAFSDGISSEGPSLIEIVI